MAVLAEYSICRPMAIFDRSWYRNLLDSTINRTLSEEELKKAYADVRAFERQLRDGGTVFFKIFLDISKKEQASSLGGDAGKSGYCLAGK